MLKLYFSGCYLSEHCNNCCISKVTGRRCGERLSTTTTTTTTEKTTETVETKGNSLIKDQSTVDEREEPNLQTPVPVISSEPNKSSNIHFNNFVILLLTTLFPVWFQYLLQ